MIEFHENAIKLILTGDYDELNTLRHDLRFRPNNYYFANSFIRYRETKGKEGWDGYTYPLEVKNGAGRIMRGYKDKVLELCRARSIPINTDNCLDSPFQNLTLADIPGDLIAADFELDENQRRSIQEWLVHGLGIAHMTVASGKTATFAGAAKMIGDVYEAARFLYVTPSERLVRQSCKDMKGFLPAWRIGQFGGGKHEKDGFDMVICTVAMLTRHRQALVQSGWFNQFYAVLYDEVHHCASDSSQEVLSNIPAFFRLGASDTMSEANPTRRHLMRGQFGPVRNRVVASGLIEIGRMARPHIYLVEIPEWKNKFKELSYQAAPGTPAWCLLEGQWLSGTYRGPVQMLDAKGKPAFKMTRTLDEKKAWITIREPILTPGLHQIEIAGEVEQIESRWCLLERLYDRGVIRFKARNELICTWACHFSQRKLKTLVVCTRTLHIFLLEALCQAAVGPELVRILFSRDSSTQRDEAFDWLRETPGAILISSVVKEGVSIHEIGAGVIADYIGSWEVANQIVGRFIRPKQKGENKAEIAWLVDNQHPSLRRGCAGIFYQLEKIMGYRFFYPCTVPEALEEASQFEGALSVLPALGIQRGVNF